MAVVVSAVLALDAAPAQAYLHLSVTTAAGTSALVWKSPRVRWYATDRSVPGVTASQFQGEVATALTTPPLPWLR